MRRPGAFSMGGFKLDERIGRGALGEVWRALGPDGQTAALRFVTLPDDLQAAEASALAGLQQLAHEDLAPIGRLWFLDSSGPESAVAGAGVSPDELALAMPLAESNLARRLAECQAQRQAGLPLEELLSALEAVGRALDYLNDPLRASPHGDVKPSNLLVMASRVRLADAGLARILGNRSHRNVLPGTPDYLAPEIQSGRGHTPTSDLYSLAIAYVELRTGQLPFQSGISLGSVLECHRMGWLDFSRLSLAEQPVVARATALEPAARYPTASEWTRALREACRPELDRRKAEASRQAASSRAAKKARTIEIFENSIGMRFAVLPAGEFVMGSPASEAGRSENEGPEHTVRISRPFAMSVFQTTQRDFQRVMGENPSHFSPEGGGRDTVVGIDTSRFPAELVTWEEACEFCRRLSALDAEREAGRKYRLPTEAEWEYACRAEEPAPFNLGENLGSSEANFDGAYPYGNARKGGDLERPARVGSYAASPWKLYDMHGNLWEWCLDGPRVYTAQTVTDPLGPCENGGLRSIRGGAWSHYAASCRSASRNRESPTRRRHVVGFRVLCEAG